MTENKGKYKLEKGVVIEVFKKEKGGVYEYADVRNGEVNLFEKISTTKRVLVDKGNYFKVFKKKEVVISRLSDGALRLFMFIAFHVGIHSDMVVFNYDTLNDWCGMKRTTYFSSVNELVAKDIICRKEGSLIEYFVNPNFIFNGSRLKL